MRKITTKLPSGYRLELRLVKGRRIPSETPIIPDLGKIVRARSGNKISRFFRHIFEHSKVKKILPVYFAGIVLGSSMFPPSSTVSANEAISPQNETRIVLKTESGTRFPVNSVVITQGFRLFHPGIDLDGITGDPIYPILAGKVSLIEYSRFGYGTSIIIDHGNGYTSRYAHLSKVRVQVNDTVDIHTIIGDMGATGRSFGDHLHLEIYQDNVAINPMTLLPK